MKLAPQLLPALFLICTVSLPSNAGAATQWASECPADSFVSVNGVAYQEQYPWTTDWPFPNIRVYLVTKSTGGCAIFESILDSTASAVSGAFRFACVPKSLLGSGTLQITAPREGYVTAWLSINDTNTSSADLHMVPQGSLGIVTGTIYEKEWIVKSVCLSGNPCTATNFEQIPVAAAGATIAYPVISNAIIYEAATYLPCTPMYKKMVDTNTHAVTTDASGTFSFDISSSYWSYNARGEAVISKPGYDTLREWISLNSQASMRIDTEYIIRKTFPNKASTIRPSVKTTLSTDAATYQPGQRLFARLDVTANSAAAPTYQFMKPGLFGLSVKDAAGTVVYQFNTPVAPMPCNPSLPNCGLDDSLIMPDTLSFDFPPALALTASARPYTATARFNSDTATDVSVLISVSATGIIVPPGAGIGGNLAARFDSRSRTLLISSSTGAALRADIFSENGRLVSTVSEAGGPGETAVCFSNRAPGVYVVRIASDGISKTLRLLNSR